MNVPRHEFSVLQTWVATSGCWTAASVLLPDERLAVYAAPVLGVLLVVATMLAHRRLNVPERQRPTLLTFVSTFPTLFGLAAAAVATHGAVSQGMPLEAVVSSLLDLYADKLLIIKLFLAAYLAEQSIPLLKLLGRKVKRWFIAAGRCWLRALKPELEDLVDALNEGDQPPGSKKR
ncbi:hypothetical protein C8D87_1139 [Lentzea atacamensis]|uniref:Transmembrane protein n=1 Tax=Lentzea atacamensis TaxID=531938 RepID=A0ABX9DYS5_9PSEU|nr:hypothetical protein [Lentzea atacamensis]RAS59709.1 hypothetical protein C8D87_1139 [Lentzea atacamensis]